MAKIKKVKKFGIGKFIVMALVLGGGLVYGTQMVQKNQDNRSNAATKTMTCGCTNYRYKTVYLCMKNGGKWKCTEKVSKTTPTPIKKLTPTPTKGITNLCSSANCSSCSSPKACSSAGCYWNTAVSVCEKKVCTSGSKRCYGTYTQVCTSGKWVNQTKCDYKCDNGNCVR